jgi:hypothetical protein
MTEQNWNVVMRTNKILTGQRLINTSVTKGKDKDAKIKHLVVVERGALTGIS